MSYRQKTCEKCKFRVESDCRKNPPIEQGLIFKRISYPKVKSIFTPIQAEHSQTIYQNACSFYKK